MGEQRVPAVIVGAQEACGLGLVRSLACGDIPILVVDNSPLQPAMQSRFARGVTVPATAGRRLVDSLLQLAVDLPARPVLFLTTDEAVVTVSEHRAELANAYRFQLPAHDSLVALMEKSSFQGFAEQHGFPVPRSIRVESVFDLARLSQLSYPCVIKPSLKCAEYYARGFQRGYRVASAVEAEAICRAVQPVASRLVVQEWIEGPDTELYFCLQCRAADGRTLASFTGRKLSIWPPDIGVTTSCVAAPEVGKEVQALTEAFFAAASFAGIGSMEFKRDARTGRYFMIEPTLGRADWQEEIATLNGVNIPLAVYREQLGLEALPQPEPAACAVWSGSWRNSYRRLTGTYGRRYDAYWRLNDPLPALFYAVLGMEPVLRRANALVHNVRRSLQLRR
jgi:predicted ATP-grasp superfamily ATP-dependent carboligase